MGGFRIPAGWAPWYYLLCARHRSFSPRCDRLGPDAAICRTPNDEADRFRLVRVPGDGRFTHRRNDSRSVAMRSHRGRFPSSLRGVSAQVGPLHTSCVTRRGRHAGERPPGVAPDRSLDRALGRRWSSTGGASGSTEPRPLGPAAHGRLEHEPASEASPGAARRSRRAARRRDDDFRAFVRPDGRCAPARHAESRGCPATVRGPARRRPAGGRDPRARSDATAPRPALAGTRDVAAGASAQHRPEMGGAARIG
jgi:hypothetical protein